MKDEKKDAMLELILSVWIVNDAGVVQNITRTVSEARVDPWEILTDGRL